MRLIRTVRLLSLALVMLAMSAASFAQIGISVSFGPPALPVYEQPPCPQEGYIWTPGYWAYADDDGYYWVPGTWVAAPEPGLLWTPGYWGWGDGGYIFNRGYWGSTVGFYGGISYGFGYFGHGYEGGRWDHGQFYYNRSVNNVNVTNIHNTYNTTVINNNTTINRVSYSGGNGGVQARPTPQEEAAEHERHIPPVAAQTQHAEMARSNPQLRASVNQGKPPIAATARPADFKTAAVPAREAGAPYKAPEPRAGANAKPGEAARPENNVPRPGAETNAARPEAGKPEAGKPAAENNVPRPGNPVHAKDLPPIEKAPAPNTGNAKNDQKLQQQQAKLYAQQNAQRQKLQAQQDREHQQLAAKNASAARQAQVEQKHTQQTQQLQQRHAAQQQQIQQRAQPQHAPAPEGRPEPKK